MAKLQKTDVLVGGGGSLSALLGGGAMTRRACAAARPESAPCHSAASALFLVVVFAVATAGAVDGTWNWSATVEPSGVDVRVQQWAWDNAANWVDSTPPSGDTSVAYLVPGDQAASLASAGARWIRVPDAGVDLGEVNIRQYATIYLTGGPIRFGARSTLSNFPRIRDDDTTCTMWIYCPIDFTKKETTLNRAYFCGPVAYAKGGTIASSNTARWYANAWATNTSSMVTNPFPETVMSPGSGSVRYYARMGSPAQTGVWRTYAGSPVLTRMQNDKHTLVPGASVSGDNIPAGAFVKCIYNDAAIEISEACTGDSPTTGETVEFGAFENVKTIQHLTRITNQSSSQDFVITHYFTKYRAEDEFDVYVDDIGPWVGIDMATDTSQRSFAASQGDYFPARIFLKSAATANGLSAFVQLRRTHLVFAPSDGAAFSLYALDIAQNDNAFNSFGPRLETPAGVTATVGNIRRWTLTLTKCGAGTLDITSSTNVAHNALVCEEGTTALRMTAEAENQTLASLVVSNGATFKLAEGILKLNGANLAAGATLAAGEGATLDVSALTIPAGVTLEGPGTFLLVNARQISGAKTVGCPRFVFASQGSSRDIISYDNCEPAVVGHPAFWVSADKNVDLITFEWNGTTYNNGVACWRDCRDGETTYYATNDFSQIDFSQITVKEGVPSRYSSNMYNGRPGIQHNGLMTTGATNYRYVQSGMVWNRPITNICAVFNVIYNQGGANAILGCTKRFEEMGSARTSNDFRRGVSSTTDGGGIGTWGNYILSPSAAECVQNGWIYADGKPKGPQDTLAEFASPSQPVVWEMHPKAPYGRADAFAIQEHGGVTCSGCQYQMECIIYTNELTQTERRQVCAYLLKKWKNAVVPGVDNRFSGNANLDGFDAGGGMSVEVEDGALMGVTSMTNGTLVKTGEGTLYADLVDGASLDVREGELRIRSCANVESVIPPGQFIHLDASKTNTMVFKSYAFRGQTVAKMVETWRDPTTNVYANTRRTDGRYRPGFLAYPEALGGKPVVDYSTLTNIIAGTATSNELSAGCFHDFYIGSGTREFKKTERIGSLFMMIGSRNGGGLPLGDYDMTNWRSTTTNPAVAFLNSNAPEGLRYGEGLLNGKSVSFTSTGLSGGYDTVAVRNITGTGGDGVQNIMMGHGRRYVGGGEVGELLIYEDPLDSVTHRKVDAWLGWKWLGRKTPGFSPASAAAVSVAEGASLAVDGDAPLMAEAVSGGGVIAGSLSCATGCVVTAKVAEGGGMETLSVTGSLDASAGGTLVVEGDARLLRAGSYPVISATSAVLGGDWVVQCDCKASFKPVVRIRDGALCLDLLSKGMRISIR